MATKPRFDRDLAAAVERARHRVTEAGELSPGGGAPFQSRIPPEVGAAVGELLRNGTYAEAIARIAGDDPDLTDQ